MDAQQIIEMIRSAKKKTPVKAYVKSSAKIDFENCSVFGAPDVIVFGEWEDIRRALEKNAALVEDVKIECDRRNSALPLADIRGLNARVEPGAIIRDQVSIGERAVIMMGAVINIGAVIGEDTMIDMGAVLGGRATVGKRCHIGANAVLAGVVEPASAVPVIIEDDVLVGAGAVVLEGVRVGAGAVVAAGSVVVRDVAPGAVVAGVPARVIKQKSQVEAGKIALIDALREL